VNLYISLHNHIAPLFHLSLLFCKPSVAQVFSKWKTVMNILGVHLVNIFHRIIQLKDFHSYKETIDILRKLRYQVLVLKYPYVQSCSLIQ
jgi:hypothetical protein